MVGLLELLRLPLDDVSVEADEDELLPLVEPDALEESDGLDEDVWSLELTLLLG